jgi:hypothetical protein|uniref:Uncharacterized protein n=2 Tax=Picea TaxID=3328 RepID=A0A101M3Y3_PICGL|nr:hypothetical protein ABT39_MTgene228 [Picea glauca]QHR90103.1 hypothetical protein Q903MT_gene4126 [Picea sitchensis]
MSRLWRLDWCNEIPVKRETQKEAVSLYIIFIATGQSGWVRVLAPAFSSRPDVSQLSVRLMDDGSVPCRIHQIMFSNRLALHLRTGMKGGIL